MSYLNRKLHCHIGLAPGHAGLAPGHAGSVPGSLAGWSLAPVALAVSALVLIAGCGGPASKLTGRWQMDDTNDLHEEMVGETMQDRATGNVAEDNRSGNSATDSVAGESDEFVAARLEIEFASGGVLQTTHMMMNKPYGKVGSWKLVSENSAANPPTMQLRCEFNGEPTDTRVTFVDADTIRMIPPNFDVLGKEHTFRRVK